MAKKKIEQVETPKYNDYESAFRDRVIRDAEKSREDREQNHPEFDDMTFTEYYVSNRRAGSGYNKPKQDPSDVRITSGTTQEKKNTMIATTIGLNLEPSIKAFDDDDLEIHELGENMEDMVKKSRVIDDWEDRRIMIYNEYFEQGFVAVRECQQVYRLPEKKIEKKRGAMPDEVTWKKVKDRISSECSAKLIYGIDLYLGNIRQPEIKKQPFIIIRDNISRAEAEAIFSKWKRWKNVPLIKTNTVQDHFWMLDENEMENRVEIIEVFYKFSDEYNIMVNGVLMLPVTEDGSYPMSAELGVCEYPIAYAVSERMSNWAYSKSIPAKTKVDQAILDNFLRNAIIKDNKHTKPPLANRSSTKLSKRVYDAGYITDNVDADNIKEIGVNNGIDNATIQAIQMAKQNIDGKSMDPIIEGQGVRGGRTARETVELKEQALQKMGLPISGITSLERQLTWLRIQNILENWTKEKEPGIEGAKDAIYRAMSIESEFDDGTSGTKEIMFTENPPEPEKVYGEEKLTKILTGRNVRRTHLNPKMLRKMRYNWNIKVKPTAGDSSEIKLAKLEESLAKLPVFQQAGKMPNMDYIGDRWAILMGENPDKFWKQEQPIPPQGLPQGIPQQGAPSGPPNMAPPGQNLTVPQV